MFGKFDLGRTVSDALKRKKVLLRSGDIVVVSSKFAAMAEGRFVELAKVKPSYRAERLSKQYRMNIFLSELVVEESEAILGGIPGFALAVTNGILAPNGGIDRSNVPHGYAILYPKNPQETADSLRSSLMGRLSPSRLRSREPDLGVVLSDSRVTPARLGTIGIAIAASGFDPIADLRGSRDLFGNKLKVTVRAVADEIASAAQLVMGEASESVPIVVVRGCNARFRRKQNPEQKLSMLIPHEKCIYIQGLKNSVKI